MIPQFTVLMSFYNGKPFLKNAIDSRPSQIFIKTSAQQE